MKKIIQTSDGGYIMGGITKSGINGDKSDTLVGNSDYWILKLDSTWTKQWDKVVGGDSVEWLSGCFHQTADGGYILGGSSFSGISGDKSDTSRGTNDFWIIKIDSTGNKEWDMTFGGMWDDRMTDGIQTLDGGYIFTGWTWGIMGSSYGDITDTCRGNYDVLVLKIDSAGNKQWDKIFGGTSADFAYSVYQNSDSSYILGGHSRSGISGDKTDTARGGKDYWIIKIDKSGNKIWDKTFGGSSDDWAVQGLKQFVDGSYIIGGHSNSGISSEKSEANRGDFDYWILKIDSAGSKLWDKTYGGSNYERLVFLELTSDNGCVFGGGSKSGLSGDKTEPSWGNTDAWFVCVDSNGNKLWDKSFGGTSVDNGKGWMLTSDTGFIFACTSSSGISGDKSDSSKGDKDFWIIKAVDCSITGKCGTISGTVFVDLDSSCTQNDTSEVGLRNWLVHLER